MLRRIGVFDQQRGWLFNWTPVAYGAGIGLYFALPVEPSAAQWWGVGAVLAASLLALWWGPGIRRWPLFAALIVALCGAGVAGLRSAHVAAPKLEYRYYGPVEGRIVAIDRSQSDAVRLTLDHIRLLDVPPARLPKRVRISLHGQQGFLDPRPGQVIAVTGHLSPPAGPVEPGGYDFRRQAWFAGIGAVGYARNPALVIDDPPPAGVALRIARIRHAMSRHVQAALPGPAGGFATAITTGDRSAIPRDVLEDLRATNLAHLLAISGLHMGLLTGVVFTLLRICFAAIPRVSLYYPTKKWAALGALLAGAVYLALSGGNVATERAFIMVGVMFGAVLIDHRAITLRAVAVAALIVLTLRPEALYGPGFQMSFAATTALVAVYGELRRFRRARTWPKAAQWIGGVALSSLIAGLATAPIAAAHFNQVPHYGLVANVLSVPVMGAVIMPAAVLAAVLVPVGLEGVGFWFMELGILWILAVADWVADWPGVVSKVAAPSAAVLPILTFGALWLVLWKGPWRGAGIGGVILALVLWAGSDRPVLLIADSGRLMGVMTETGRALSKEKGDGFAARVWLENDGDPLTQSEAAARWTGQVELAGFRVAHVTGRGAADRVEAVCKVNDLTVVSVEATVQGCQILDARALRRSGAVAFYKDDAGGYRRVTVADRSGRRPWSD